jgi:hypothetical protein
MIKDDYIMKRRIFGKVLALSKKEICYYSSKTYSLEVLNIKTFCYDSIIEIYNYYSI